MTANYSAFLDYFPTPYITDLNNYESYIELPFGNTNPYITQSAGPFTPGLVTITPASMDGIVVGTSLILRQIGNCDEYGVVVAVSDTTFDLNISNTYTSAAIYIEVQPIGYIQYYDVDNKLQLLAQDIYKVDLNSEPAKVWLDYRHVWPWVYPKPNTVEINWTCGYASVDVIPLQILHAIKMLVATWFNKREDTTQAKTSTIPHGICALVDDYRILGWGY